LLVCRRAHFHERPGAQYVLLDRGADPPHGVGGEPETLVGLEAFNGLHEADIALRNHFTDRKAIAAITHGDLCHEPEVAGDELVGGIRVAVLAPALGKHELLIGFQHRKAPDLVEVVAEPAVRGYDWKRRTRHDRTFPVGSPKRSRVWPHRFADHHLPI